MKKWKTPSRTSPKGTKRGCLCADGKKDIVENVVMVHYKHKE